VSAADAVVEGTNAELVEVVTRMLHLRPRAFTVSPESEVLRAFAANWSTRAPALQCPHPWCCC
jgi:hypothetical protein